ncbi:MAG TPA: HAMP domain-containing sensor histidine kinase [Bacteroidia bacterium]|nr:HAMP domain-containing sensor histidine kinase [Bacteroidia bacterium]
MNIYTQKQQWKLLLLASAILIGLLSLWYTNNLVKKLSEEERKKVQLWAEASKQLANISVEAGDISFSLMVLQDNNTVPAILTDESGNILSHINLDTAKVNDTQYVQEMLLQMKERHEPIEISFANNQKNFIYYEDSGLLYQLRYYPYFQLAIIALFLLVSYLAFSTSRKAEQNQVWVGMAKETAHQLGTPLSSLMAWIEYFKSTAQDQNHVEELEKDVARLNTITERFSKIGSAPVLRKEDVYMVIENTISYIRSRTSSKVIFSLNKAQPHQVLAPLNIPLFEWVLENLFKNAVDAMDGEGKIDVMITDQLQFVYIDIADSGKGIPKSKFKTVFKPGYTSKTRGWGLGLSLSKRIVEEYHNGHIFVKNSEPNNGTTFRIVLKKQV